MARVCMNCGKGVQYGHNVSHAKNRTRKLFQANLHVARVQIGEHKRKVRLCTKCLRMFKTLMKEETSEKSATQATS